MVDMAALASIVEALQDTDREVDAEIAIAVDGGEIVWLQANGTMDMYPARQYVSAMHVRGFGRAPIPAYTASIDAAMALLPENWVVASLEWWPVTTRSSVTLREVRKNSWGIGYDEDCGDARSWASTPALAITAAAIRALAHRNKS